jgi:glycerophosphoryl diester phosphodiesterase
MAGYQSPLWIAHRGESRDAPENTLASVNLAWERGVPAVEIDVRVSLDGLPVVIHNATTGHMAGTDWRVSRRTHKELKTLDFGRRRGKAWKGERMPKLDQILDTIPTGGRLFIEIKAGPEAIQPIRKALAGSRVRSEQIALIAFKRNLLSTAAQIMPDCEASWIVDLRRHQSKPTATEAERLANLVRSSGLNGLDLGMDASCDFEIIRLLQEHGLPVYCWTVNDLPLARRLIAAGIDGITSDRAAWLMGRLKKKSRRIR